jgi:hypothetical protein
VHALVPYAGAQCMHNYFLHLLRSHKINNIKIESVCVRSVYTSVTIAYAQCTGKLLNACTMCTHKFLIRMLGVRRSSWYICLAYP